MATTEHIDFITGGIKGLIKDTPGGIIREPRLPYRFGASSTYVIPYGNISNPEDVLNLFAQLREEYKKGNVNESVEAILKLLEHME